MNPSTRTAATRPVDRGLEVASMSIRELIAALSATERQLSHWRAAGSAPAGAPGDPRRERIIIQQAQLIRELRGRREALGVMTRRAAHAAAARRIGILADADGPPVRSR